MKLPATLDLPAHLIVDLEIEIIDRCQGGAVHSAAQNESETTYSLWRDAEDFRIGWSRLVQQIVRFVDSIEVPYAGAWTMVDGVPIVVCDAPPLHDVSFAVHEAEKTWRIDRCYPAVVFVDGLPGIDHAEASDD